MNGIDRTGQRNRAGRAGHIGGGRIVRIRTLAGIGRIVRVGGIGRATDVDRIDGVGNIRKVRKIGNIGNAGNIGNIENIGNAGSIRNIGNAGNARATARRDTSVRPRPWRASAIFACAAEIRASIRLRAPGALGVLVCSAALALSGCDLAPLYHPPAMLLPAHYSGTGPFVRATPGAPPLTPDWWTLYHDVQLNRLEQHLNAANPDLAAAIQTYAQARDVVGETRAGLFPQLGASGQASEDKESEHTLFHSGNGPLQESSVSVGMAASWAPDFWGAARNRTRAAERGAQASAADLAAARLSLETSLASDYMALRGLDAEHAVYRRALALYRNALRITQLRLAGQIASGLDVERARNQLASAQAADTEVLAQRAVLEHAVAVLAGFNPVDFHLPEAADAANAASTANGANSPDMAHMANVADSADAAQAVEMANTADIAGVNGKPGRSGKNRASNEPGRPDAPNASNPSTVSTVPASAPDDQNGQRGQAKRNEANDPGVPDDPALAHMQPAIPTLPLDVPSLLLQRRPDIAAAERRMAAASATIGIARAAFFPNVSLGASGGLAGTSLQLASLPNTLWAVGASAMLPLFDGGLRHARLQASWASFSQTGDQYRAVVLRAFREVEDNLSLTSRLAQEAAEQDIALRAADRVQRMALSLYTGGIDNYLNVSVAQIAALDAQIAAVRLHTRRLQASVALIGALGGGWSAHALPSGAQTVPGRRAMPAG